MDHLKKKKKKKSVNIKLEDKREIISQKIQLKLLILWVCHEFLALNWQAAGDFCADGNPQECFRSFQNHSSSDVKLVEISALGYAWSEWKRMTNWKNKRHFFLSFSLRVH